MQLLPKFSLRQIMYAMVGIALIMACVASAARGSMIGLCMATGFVSLSLPLICLALCYWGAIAVRKFMERIWPGLSAILLVLLTTELSTESASAQSLVRPGKQGYHVTVNDRGLHASFGYFTMNVKLEKMPSAPATSAEVGVP